MTTNGRDHDEEHAGTDSVGSELVPVPFHPPSSNGDGDAETELVDDGSGQGEGAVSDDEDIIDAEIVDEDDEDLHPPASWHGPGTGAQPRPSSPPAPDRSPPPPASPPPPPGPPAASFAAQVHRTGRARAVVTAVAAAVIAGSVTAAAVNYALVHGDTLAALTVGSDDGLAECYPDELRDHPYEQHARPTPGAATVAADHLHDSETVTDGDITTVTAAVDGIHITAVVHPTIHDAWAEHTAPVADGCTGISDVELVGGDSFPNGSAAYRVGHVNGDTADGGADDEEAGGQDADSDAGHSVGVHVWIGHVALRATGPAADQLDAQVLALHRALTTPAELPEPPSAEELGEVNDDADEPVTYVRCPYQLDDAADFRVGGQFDAEVTEPGSDHCIHTSRRMTAVTRKTDGSSNQAALRTPAGRPLTPMGPSSIEVHDPATGWQVRIQGHDRYLDLGRLADDLIQDAITVTGN